MSDAAIVAAAARDVYFAADDRLHAARGGFVVKMLGGKEIAVIGDGHGGHAAAGGFVNQFRDVASAVEKTVIGVQMQMDETRSCHGGFIVVCAARFFQTNAKIFVAESTTIRSHQQTSGDDE